LPIPVGITAPDFTLMDETNTARSLSDFRGQVVVLYFYPRDDTPGCTMEACDFRDDYSVYRKAGIVILGISPDSSQSHAKFLEKHHLPFPLLADEGHTVCDLYGVWGTKKVYGRQLQGVLRTTFLIDPYGKIIHVFKNVKPEKHSKEILATLWS